MERRRFLAATVACLAGLAGCAGLFGSGAEPSEPTDSDAGEPTTAGRTPTATTASTATATTGDDEPSPKRLRLSSQAGTTLDVAIVIVSEPDGERVYDKSHAFPPGHVLTVHNLFERGVDYRLAVRIDGETVFERLVRSFQAYDLVIQSETTVTVGEKHET